MSNKYPIKLSIDVGGTFTDFALLSGAQVHTLKIPTTPSAPEVAIIDGARRLIESAGHFPQEVAAVVHGTTLATNAIIERRGARTALITTEGFRDVLEMADESRFDQYDLRLRKPKPLVPRWMRHSIRERVCATGDVLLPIDEAGVIEVAEKLTEQDIESVAICFLHSHVNNVHEVRVMELLSDVGISIPVSLSSRVSPEMGEYERSSTTAANAYVQPLISQYLRKLENGFSEMGISAPIFMFDSNGGLCDIQTARSFPIRLVESGPAGGAMYAAQIAKRLGLEEVIAFDMGGTTAKVCLIENGEPQRSNRFEMAREHLFRQGSGLPARIPSVELIEIGAGGGSIANVDELKRLTVGPTSAGSEPGPACYNRGGNSPTVTDANLVLKNLDPKDFVSSDIQIAPDHAVQAVEVKVSQPLSVCVNTGARGILEVVEQQMANAARQHARENGADLRDRAMIAFGGAAPLHAAKIASSLGISTVIIPPNAGVGSAVGFAMAGVVVELSKSVNLALSEFDFEALNSTLAELTEDARKRFERAAPESRYRIQRNGSFCYRGQAATISIDLGNSVFSELEASELAAKFSDEYAEIYSRPLKNIPIECVAVSVRVTADDLDLEISDDLRSQVASDRQRDVRASDANSTYFRNEIPGHMTIFGPSLIKDVGTTIVVPSGYNAICDAQNNIVLTQQDVNEE